MDGLGVSEAAVKVQERIEQAVANGGQRIAVRGPDATLTYAELSARADRLAGALRAAGVRPGDLVAECLERSAALVVAALAAVRVGAAYVALDPGYPDARLGFMLADSGAAALLTDAATEQRLDGAFAGPRIVVGPDGAPVSGVGAAPPRPRVHPAPGDLAYVVYTSGSTGEPKGVEVEHAGLENLVRWHLDAFALGPEDATTQIASPGFDAAAWEIWPTLAAGATLHVVPDACRADPVALRDWLLAEGISVSFVPTALAESLIGLEWPATARLRTLLTGGDALTRRPQPGLPFAVVNNYGLSETTVVATSGVVAADGDGTPSIGRPIAGVAAQVLDAELRPVAAGEPGELVVGGVAVARGYLGRPDLTAERFLETNHGRLYRTGDRVRVRPDGELEFLGRLDDQVSIRGFRIEPAEVARALEAHPGVEAALVVGAGAPGPERRLVAYAVAAGDDPPGARELAAFLTRTVPEHMVPSAYAWLPAMPLTAHGKVDRAALPAPDPIGTPAPARVAPAGPAASTGAAVAEIVAELLDVPAVGMEENFFLLGGHSLLGAQLILRLEERFGVEVGLRYLFDHPTPAEIAAEIDRRDAEHPAIARIAG